MSEQSGFVEKLSLEEARAEVLRLDARLLDAQRVAAELEQNVTRTVWLLVRSVPGHRIVITPGAAENYGIGQPELERRDLPGGGAEFVARLLEERS